MTGDTLLLPALAALGLILAKLVTELWLSLLNRRHVLRHVATVPEAFQGVIDEATYAKSRQYTLAKGRVGRVEDLYHAVVLVGVLFSGVLPWILNRFEITLGTSVWSMALFVFVVALGLWLTGLPFDWYGDFHLERRFGFNKTTPGLWMLDRLKGFLLALVLGYPLLVLLLKFVEWAGPSWWLWAWAALLAFQLVMSVLAPVLIMPLFNRFTPLPEGSLRDRLLALAGKTDFRAQSIQVMDGSRRSAHSNAFFTGFGRFRKIVLFDTLIDQLSGAELEGVLAHEIGHYKLKHIVRMLVFSAAMSLVGFWILSLLARADWFYEAFGFEPATGNLAPALLVFSLLSGAVTFWLSPLVNTLSRRHEFAADAYAVKVIGSSEPLIGALRKLTEKNLGNLMPHPVYSAFYYSHPTLLEREAAMRAISG